MGSVAALALKLTLVLAMPVSVVAAPSVVVVLRGKDDHSPRRPTILVAAHAAGLARGGRSGRRGCRWLLLMGARPPRRDLLHVQLPIWWAVWDWSSLPRRTTTTLGAATT